MASAWVGHGSSVGGLCISQRRLVVWQLRYLAQHSGTARASGLQAQRKKRRNHLQGLGPLAQWGSLPGWMRLA